jgi:hypothetical protein
LYPSLRALWKVEFVSYELKYKAEEMLSRRAFRELYGL